MTTGLLGQVHGPGGLSMGDTRLILKHGMQDNSGCSRGQNRWNRPEVRISRTWYWQVISICRAQGLQGRGRAGLRGAQGLLCCPRRSGLLVLQGMRTPGGVGRQA